MRALLATLILAAACDEGRVAPTPPPSGGADATASPGEDAAEDAGAPPGDAGALDVGASADATAVDGAAAPDAGPMGDPRLARDLTLEDVALFQAVKITLVEDGVDLRPRNGPVIAGRSARVRLYVRPGAGWAPQAVTGVVEIDGARFERVLTVSGPSSDDRPASAFDLEIPAAQLREGAVWSARLEAATGAPVASGASDPARFPRVGGTTPLRAQSDGGGLKLMLVPMRYETDGSNRLPDTSPAQLGIYRDLLATLYPVATVDIQVHAPVAWNRALTFRGNVNFDALTDLLLELREQEAPANDVYYYALISPDVSFDAYCGGGCVTGQSYVPEDVRDAELRVGAGVGFGGLDSAYTLVHELGHMHGRYHAPCDVSDADFEYPYADGDIGVWGFDPRDGSFVEPNAGWSDFMGYCEDQWVSDYTFKAIFERVIEQRGGRVIERSIPWWSFPLTIDRAAGAAEVGAVKAWRGRPKGEEARAVFLDPLGRALGEGRATRLVRSHELTERWWIDAPPAGAARVRVDGAGTFSL